MNYEEALEYIHGTKKFGIKLGLKNMKTLLELMGNPHKKLRYVHVGGTNGKGSTVSLISSILMASGYKTGIYTSPYIERFTERMKIDRDEISGTELARITSFVKAKAEEMTLKGANHPTEFELVTAIAFQYFYESRCDVVVLEVGLGGRYDSTNVIDTPLVSVITTISLDHMDILGDTLPSIAYEKAGIIKPEGDVVIYPQESEVMAVFQEACREKGASSTTVDFSRLKLKSFGLEGQVFDYAAFQGLQITLLGEHQTRNAAVAVETCKVLQGKGFDISEGSLRKGLVEARWPGRFELLRANPVFIVDGAHNEEGARMLANNLMKYFPGEKIQFILGVLKDKDYGAMVEAVAPVAAGFIAVTPDNPRALDAKELAIFLHAYCKNVQVSDTIEKAVRASLGGASPSRVVCAFGSLYYIGSIRGVLEDCEIK